MTTTTEQLNFLDHFEALRSAGAIDDLGLDFEKLEGMSFDEWESLGRYLGQGNSAFRWSMGDWLLFGEGSYGERHSQAMDVTGLRFQTLKNYAWVAGAVKRSRRRDSVSWSHHEAIASLPPREQRRWLDKAEREEMTVETLRDSLRVTRSSDSDDPAEPEQRITVSAAARQVWITSAKVGEMYHVPADSMLRLARAIGEKI
ncbi:MAG: LmbU family transcriptional regulator [Actinobacteria bacterium]|nr:LmbU family transcriptional regulator [Actinomycetota bacterium]